MATIQKKRLRAVEKRFERAPVYVAPYFDEMSKLFYIGQKEFKSREITTAKGDRIYEAVGTDGIVLTNVDQIPVSAGLIIADKAGEIILQMLKDRGYIAPSKDAANISGGHRFYVEDETAAALEVSKKADQTLEALNLLREMSDTDKKDLALFLQLPVANQSAQVIEGLLKNLALTSPTKITEGASNRAFKAGAILERLVNAGIVAVDAGKYLYGSGQIGTDRAMAIEYLMLPANGEQLKEMMKQLKLQESN